MMDIAPNLISPFDVAGTRNIPTGKYNYIFHTDRSYAKVGTYLACDVCDNLELSFSHPHVILMAFHLKGAVRRNFPLG